MKFILHLLFLFCTLPLVAQQPESGNTSSIPSDPDYYDFVKFYLNEAAADTTEGSFIAQLKKQNRIWGERLFPTGNPQIPGGAITNYAKNFNINGIQNCVIKTTFAS